jgi:hypothetical protein
MFTFPLSPVGAKDRPRSSQRPEDQPPSGRGAHCTVEAADRRGAAPESAGSKRAAPELGSSGRPTKKSWVRSKM